MLNISKTLPNNSVETNQFGEFTNLSEENKNKLFFNNPKFSEINQFRFLNKEIHN